MNRFQASITSAAFALTLVPLGAQNTDPDWHPAIPTVTYECYWEATKPQDYVIKMQSTGNTTYLSRNPAPEATGAQTSEAPQTAQAARNAAFDPDYQVAFLMSAANRDNVLKLAAQANFFNGNFDYTKHAMANTGRKTLTYADTARHFQTVYNYSENRAIQELTGLFQNISTTLESGRKLAFKHKYDKLGLEAELKALEEEAANHNLAEVQVIAPVLQQIADDPTVLNIARQRARKLLGKAK